MTDNTLTGIIILSFFDTILLSIALTFFIKRFYNFIAVVLIKKRIKTNPEIYKKFISLCDETRKQLNIYEFICSRKKIQKNAINDYYEDSKYLPQTMLKEKEQEVDRQKEFMCRWETLRQEQWKNWYYTKEKMEEYAKFYGISIKNIDKIRQAIA